MAMKITIACKNFANVFLRWNLIVYSKTENDYILYVIHTTADVSIKKKPLEGKDRLIDLELLLLLTIKCMRAYYLSLWADFLGKTKIPDMHFS